MGLFEERIRAGMANADFAEGFAEAMIEAAPSAPIYSLNSASYAEFEYCEHTFRVVNSASPDGMPSYHNSFDLDRHVPA